MFKYSHVSRLLTLLNVLFSITIRYHLLAGLCYAFFYVWKKKIYWKAKIQQRYPENKHILKEIANSVITILIFGAVIILVIYSSKHGWTRIYPHINDKGLIYYIFSIVLMIFMHDT